MTFKLLNTNRFPLAIEKETNYLPYYRFDHRATIGYNLREFMIFIDNGTPYKESCVYIEEITGGHLEQIKDDSLHEAIAKFIDDHNLCLILPPIPKRLPI